jgi:hypothetical protein
MAKAEKPTPPGKPTTPGSIKLDKTKLPPSMLVNGDAPTLKVKTGKAGTKCVSVLLDETFAGRTGFTIITRKRPGETDAQAQQRALTEGLVSFNRQHAMLLRLKEAHNAK